MKRRRLFIIFSVSIAALILALTLWPREREPEYNGVPLNKWLERYNDGDNVEATQALRHIGTNALPCLFRWIQYEAPGWRIFLVHLHTRLPSSVQKTRASHWLLDDKAEHRAQLAAEAFGALGPNNPATDELRRLALTENPRAPNTQRRATFALMNLGPSAPIRDYFDTRRVR
jgi:hypothetical protein